MAYIDLGSTACDPIFCWQLFEGQVIGRKKTIRAITGACTEYYNNGFNLPLTGRAFYIEAL